MLCDEYKGEKNEEDSMLQENRKSVLNVKQQGATY